MTPSVLEDLLRPGLRVVFCGTAAGTASALKGEYYAGRGNRFWSILQATGLTDGEHPLSPNEWRSLDDCDIGLTDLWKSDFGPDSSLPRNGFDTERLRRAIEANAPEALAFNGLKAARAFLGRPAAYGLQQEAIGETAIWVLPSTSGAANGSWDSGHWHDLANSLRQIQKIKL